VPTPYAALRRALADDPARPLVTYLGPAGRTELSVRTFENGVAKAAGLLRDGLDVQPGDTVALLLPLHWQTSVWLGACWAVGAVAAVDPSDAATAVVALATTERLDEVEGAVEVLRVGTHPFGLPSRDPLPPGVQEAAIEVRAHGDVFVPYAEPADSDTALRLGAEEFTATAVMAAASDLATGVGLEPGGRLLTRRPPVELDAVLALLAVPLAAQAAVVLAAAGGDPEDLTAERITATL
jgi:uncharacterized protein (TIGR03089 family)